MAIVKRSSRSLSKVKPRKRSTTTTKKKKKKTSKSTGVTRSYTILKKSKFNPEKKLSSQGKTVQTTKTGAHLASRYALAKRKRPTRVYLYRHKKIMIYAIKYCKVDGKVKSAIAKRIKTVSAKGKAKKKTNSSTKKKKRRKTKKKTTCTCAVKGSCAKKKRKKKTTGSTSEITRLKKKLATLQKPKMLMLKN